MSDVLVQTVYSANLAMQLNFSKIFVPGKLSKHFYIQDLSLIPLLEISAEKLFSFTFTYVETTSYLTLLVGERN